ncbi:MAG: sulfotransferase [Planctomycetota bacterium]
MPPSAAPASPAAPATLPDAIHVGFSKCASTFLQAFFEDHPEVFLVNQSHFFTPFGINGYDKGPAYYAGLFAGAQPGQVKLESDEHIVLPLFHPVLKAAATTLESVRQVAGMIHATQPGARILMMVRNQVGLMASRYSEYLIGGGRHGFMEFVEEFFACSTDGVDYFQNEYSRVYDVFAQTFGAQNVLVLLQEELAADEDATLQSLCGFLGVEFRRPQQRSVWASRKGLSLRGAGVMRAFNRRVVSEPQQSHLRAKTWMPYPVYKLIARGIRTADHWAPASLKGDKNALLTPEVRRRIQQRFEADNRRLGELLGKDLSRYRYHA